MAPITRLIELERLKPAGQAKKSAVLILFYPDNGKTRLILIKRALDRSVHSGQVSFPGGKQEKSDRNLEATALREAYEEIGIAPEAVTIIGMLSSIYIPPSNFEVFPFVGFVPEKPVLNGNIEVQRILEVEFAELRNPATRIEKPVFNRNGEEVLVPCYFIQNEIIWGATAMILSELVEVAGEIEV